MDPVAPILSPPLAAALAHAHRGDPQAWDEFAVVRRDALLNGPPSLALIAAAGMLVMGQNFWRFDLFDECVAELAPLREGAAGLAPEEEMLALSGLLSAVMMGQPHDPFIASGAARLQELVERGLDVNLTLTGVRTLALYADRGSLRDMSMRLHALVQARAAEPAATPYRVGQWFVLWSRIAQKIDQPRLAAQALSRLHALARRHGLRRLEVSATLFEMDSALPGGDLATALDALARAEAQVDSGQLSEMLALESAKARLARLRGHADDALRHASLACGLARALKLPQTMYASYLVSEAQARLLGDDFEGARAILCEQESALAAAYAGELRAMVQGIDVFLAVRDARPDAEQALAALWRDLRERRSYDLFQNFPEFCARLCVMALERGIEVDFVRTLIAQRGLAAPPSAPASWPWPMRIQALGGFAVWRADLPCATEGKAQRKPLALLQAVIALGALREGRGVEVTELVELLWADEDAAVPKASFDSALARLRRWLGVEGALKIIDGRLSLNSRLVWCDVEAFERLCDELQHAASPHADARALPRLLQQLGTLYQGKLFGSAALAPWSVLARERLALRFARAVADAGAHLETHRRWDDALRLYHAALVQDMLAEPIHRALMRCQLALGQRAEARRSFERCKAVLAAELGVAPSAETCQLVS